ncbi:CPBP family intramembrane glutamic endopeptidase [Lederbergia panacisoli]|uniref:CPBP family intramembrane glutamic endopeptidase n=1 Tax=Lederbergia panacisoli TaxID=1255251 RepID=UPI00214B600B|nr:type II CAAX endopeptidase family protein [Lederbergia panacisoli]MCR2823588.1 CPBP family intramembrane metalloprotease [Lederbergia panacisoli]
MNKKYLYILITYIAMQLSVFIGMPLVAFAGVLLFHVDLAKMEILATGIWVVFSFFVGLIIILLILRKSEPYTRVEKGEPMPVNQAIIWAIGGIFIAFVAQMIGIYIETALGIKPGSENTEHIMSLIKLVPFVVLSTSIFGPILEEIVFRKVIFGMLYNRFPFWVAALLSSLVFSLAHFDPMHIILYAAMGFTFSFLYVKTKRIIVPIISHMMMNTIVTVVQFKYMNEQAGIFEWVHGWIGGFF